MITIFTAAAFLGTVLMLIKHRSKTLPSSFQSLFLLIETLKVILARDIVLDQCLMKLHTIHISFGCCDKLIVLLSLVLNLIVF